MDIIHDRAVGIDISKRDAKVCLRLPSARQGQFSSAVSTWASTAEAVLELRSFLDRQHVTTVAMEATGDYWKPVYYALEGTLPVLLVNAKNARNIPGRKTDVSDAVWLAQLAACGLLKPSFVPPPPIRELRDLTRARAISVRDRTREIQRLEKFLESSGIKLSAVVSSLTGVSSRQILDDLIAGQRDPQILAAHEKGKLKQRIPELTAALNGTFGDHHALMTKLYLEQIDAYSRRICTLTQTIELLMQPFRQTREALCTIPGVSERVADVIICGNRRGHERLLNGRPTRVMGRSLPRLQGIRRTRQIFTYPPWQQIPQGGTRHCSAGSFPHQRNLSRGQIPSHFLPKGPNESLVAAEHSILTAAWNMLANGECYSDPGPDHFMRLEPDRAKNRALHQLKQLGYEVTVAQLPA
jgi:transposase